MPGCNCLSTYIKMRDKDNYLWKFTYGLYKRQNSRVNNMMAIVWNESVRVAFNLITIVLITPQPIWPSGDCHSSVHMWTIGLWMKMLKQVEMFLPIWYVTWSSWGLVHHLGIWFLKSQGVIHHYWWSCSIVENSFDYGTVFKVFSGFQNLCI